MELSKCLVCDENLEKKIVQLFKLVCGSFGHHDFVTLKKMALSYNKITDPCSNTMTSFQIDYVINKFLYG